MMGLALVVVSAAIAAVMLGRSSPGPPFTRVLAVALVFFAVLEAVGWLLALTGLFHARALLVSFGLVGAAALVTLVRSRPKAPRVDARALLVLLPVLVFAAFVAWRGYQFAVQSHDGNMYHLPKAILLIRNHGYGYFDTPVTRVAAFPYSYEVLLAIAVALTGSDAHTHLISIVSYLGYVVAAGALAEGWLGGGSRLPVFVAVLSGAVPVALLQAAAHKNDLLLTTFVLGAAVFTATFLKQRRASSAALAIVALALALGTKVAGAFAVIGVALACLVFAPRTRRALAGIASRSALGLAALALASGLLLGPVHYVASVVRSGSASGGFVNTAGAFPFGEWRNLFYFPPLLLWRPFDPDPELVTAWSGQKWWWPKHDHMFATLGEAFTIGVALLPAAVLLRRRHEAPLDRAALATILGVTALLTVLVRFAPFGFFNGFPRYLLFLAPLVFAASFGELGARLRWQWVAGLLVTVVFSLSAARAVLRDPYYPFVALRDRWNKRDALDRHLPWQRWRAAVLADAEAGPDATIAFDGDTESYLRPLYGAGLGRRVLFIRGAVPEADWVVIDRSWNKLFGHPGMRDLTRFADLGGKGPLTGADLAVYRSLLADPRFRLVFFNEDVGQALFQRVK
jgi:hypothetical protein